MELIDNVNKTLKDDLTVSIQKDSKISIAAACFSIYAFQELKRELKNVDELRFIFTSPTFIKEKAKKEKREFYIPRQTRERSLYGSEFEVKLRNEMTQRAIAKECAEWIRKKATFKSNVTSENMMGFMNVDSNSYMPLNGFTTIDLGCERGNNAYYPIQKTDTPMSQFYLDLFEQIWNDEARLQEVTDEVVDSITTVYSENSPDYIYFVTLYNIFNEFLEDVSEDVLPNEATGFKDSKIWNLLYNFQKDAVLAIINKLEKYNGCILADSVGLGKTFTSLAVIKYYENRNKSVLVLCPKKLANNWNTYKDKNDYIDDNEHITEQYRADLENNALAPLAEELKTMTEGIHKLIQSIFNDKILEDMIGNGNETTVPSNDLNENFAKKEFQTLWNYINHKYAYTVDFDSNELIKKAIEHIDRELFVSQLQYTVSKSEQRDVMDAMMVRESNSFYEAKSSTTILKHSETSQIKYDLIGKIAEGTVLTRKTVAAIFQGISPIKFAMFKNNPEEFITKVIRLIKEQKATMIVEHISYDQIEGKYDSSIFTAEKHASFDKAYRAKKHIQDYVFTDGTAEKSVERRFAEELDGAKEVCVYAKLPKGFAIPTPVGSYSPDWAIAFYEGTVKHIYFIAETKGTMESLELRPIEKAKISCARKLFNEISTENVVYHDVDSYQNLLNIMNSIEK